MSIDDLVKVANSPGALLAFTLLAILAGARGWWVFGRTYDQLRRERDEWKTTAQAAIKNTEKLLTHFDRDPRKRERQST